MASDGVAGLDLPEIGEDHLAPGPQFLRLLRPAMLFAQGMESLANSIFLTAKRSGDAGASLGVVARAGTDSVGVRAATASEMRFDRPGIGNRGKMLHRYGGIGDRLAFLLVDRLAARYGSASARTGCAWSARGRRVPSGEIAQLRHRRSGDPECDFAGDLRADAAKPRTRVSASLAPGLAAATIVPAVADVRRRGSGRSGTGGGT